MPPDAQHQLGNFDLRKPYRADIPVHAVLVFLGVEVLLQRDYLARDTTIGRILGRQFVDAVNIRQRQGVPLTM